MDSDARDRAVAAHYALTGLTAAIRGGLARLGDGAPTVDILGAVDEFHMGGRAATKALAEALGLQPGARVLDVGCGIGGTARWLAAHSGARVEGVDLTPEFVAVGRALTEEVGLAGQVNLQQGNALALPFEADSFDAAVLLHVGMNIADKAALFAGIAGVLRPGGRFAVYDVMRVGGGDFGFPQPWAGGPDVSFVETPAAYRAALAAAGLAPESEVDRRALALEMFAAMRARMAAGGPPPLGLHLVMGPDGPVKIANVVAALEAGVIAPVQIVARKG